MTRYKSPNEIIRYLQSHDWVWFTVSDLCGLTGCKKEDITDMFTVSTYGNSIDKKNGKYRYIGNYTATKRRIVEYLKDIYPNCASANQIRKGANIDKNIGFIIRKYSDLLPIEIIGKRNFEYRYLPDDIRSIGMLCFKISKTQIIEAENSKVMQRIKDYLISIEPRRVCARDIASGIDESINVVLSRLNQLKKQNRHIQSEKCRNVNMYFYVRKIQPDVFA